MPIYEFRCRDCGTITETLVFSTAQGGACACRKCGGKRTERIMSRPAVKKGRCAGKDSGAPDRAANGSWPGNDDYVRLKGQQ